VLKKALDEAGLSSSDEQLPASVHVSNGISRLGKKIHYYFNYSGTEVKVGYDHGAGTNLLDGKAVGKGQELTLPPWDLAIVEE
jgi:beta-galactosidase